MIASDTAGNTYYPITCLYETLPPKMFLARDPAAGAAILEDTDNIPTLTGGQVTKCYYIPFTADFA